MNKFFSLTDYTFISFPRQGTKRGCGVAIYISNKFLFSELKTYSTILNEVCENCVIELSHSHAPSIIIACIYKPPDTEINLFSTAFQKFLNEVTTTNKTIFVSGDTNIDLLKYGSNGKIGNFLDLTLSFGLSPTITLPTRIADNSSSLIDNIFTNYSKTPSQSFILFDDLSDHLPILFITNLFYNKLDVPRR